jgi:hypothetical protein
MDVNNTISKAMRQSLATVAVAALATGCGGDASPLAPQPVTDFRGCDNVKVPAGNQLEAHVYANGVQTYSWNGTSWVFVAPSAVLSTDAAGTNVVGIHYAGPTWQGTAGSKVVGTAIQNCSPDANSIPWLLLSAVAVDQPGVFQGATFVQRLNTAGGKAPTTPGTAAGQVTSVPYTAEYLFYRP